MKNPTALKFNLQRGSFIGLAFLLSACGGTSYQQAATAGSSSGSLLNNGNNGGSTSTNPIGITGTTGSSSSNSNLLPAYTQTFSINGQGGVTPSYSTTVTTDNILRVKLTAASAGNNVVPDLYTNASAPYSCVQYNISAMGQTTSTGLLAVNGGNMLCPNAPDNAVVDFSGRLTPGHGPVTITVTATGYDFYCVQCLSNPYGPYTAYGMYSCNMYCPSHSVYKNHTVTGNLAIQVNGTSL